MKSKKATNERIEEARRELHDTNERLKTLDFEEFREAAVAMFADLQSVDHLIIKETGKNNRKFQTDVIKAVKKANRAEMDVAFKAYENLKDRTIMLEWSMFNVFVLFRKYVLHQFVSNEDREKIAALFGMDLEAIRKEEHANQLWRILEKETGTARTKEDLDRQRFDDAYSKNPKAFITYAEIIKSGDQEIIDLLDKGLNRLMRGMDTDEAPKIVAADLTRMLEDFKAKRREAAHA